MEDFIARHLLGTFLTQIIIFVGAGVKLYFNHQTLKRDFDKKEKKDEELKEKEEKSLSEKMDKINEKLDALASKLNNSQKENVETLMGIRMQVNNVSSQAEVYEKLANAQSDIFKGVADSILEFLSKKV